MNARVMLDRRGGAKRSRERGECCLALTMVWTEAEDRIEAIVRWRG